MLKAQSIIGKKVLSRLDGQRIDSVRDIVISKDHARIVALILDEGGLFSPATAVGFENVVSFGKDAVVITDSKQVVRVDHFPAVKEIMDDRDSLVGKKVFTESGDQMGKIEDVYFDESTGNLTALEISGKLVATARNSSAQLTMSDLVSIGPDAVIINMGAVPKLEAQVAGGPKPTEEITSVMPGPAAQSQSAPDENMGGMQAGSAMPELTGESSMPMASDAPSGMPPMPSISPLPDDSATRKMSAGDADDAMSGGMGRMPDPTSGGQG